MSIINHELKTIKNYPDDGNHLECFIGIPYFRITKGEDGFTYVDKKTKEVKSYNWGDKLDKRWICYLLDDAPQNLKDITEIRCETNLNSILRYVKSVYTLYLRNEIKRLKTL